MKTPYGVFYPGTCPPPPFFRVASDLEDISNQQATLMSPALLAGQAFRSQLCPEECCTTVHCKQARAGARPRHLSGGAGVPCAGRGGTGWVTPGTLRPRRARWPLAAPAPPPATAAAAPGGSCARRGTLSCESLAGAAQRLRVGLCRTQQNFH